MRKTTKLFGLLIASGLALVGCKATGNDTDKNGTNTSGDNGTSDSGTSGGTSSGGTASNKTDWNSEEKAIFDSYFYGISVPYKNIPGETELTYEREYNLATKTAPNCSKELLDSYATLFDDSWEDYSNTNSQAQYYYYCFEKSINTEQGVRYTTIRFYGGTYDANYDDYDNNANGTGTFVLEVYDIYLYEWPTDIIDYVYACATREFFRG